MPILQASTEHAQTAAKHCGISLHDDIISSLMWAHGNMGGHTNVGHKSVRMSPKAVVKDLKL